jgi:heme oxygenase (mycobilin-producing)
MSAVTSILEFWYRVDAEDPNGVLVETLQSTRGFDGCLSVDILRDVKDPLHIVLVEKWRDIGSDNAYRAWRAGPGKSRLSTVTTAPPRLTVLEDHVLEDQ